MDPNYLIAQSHNTSIFKWPFLLDIACKLSPRILFLNDVGRPKHTTKHQKLNISTWIKGSSQVSTLHLSELKNVLFWVRLFTCNIWTPIKGYLSNYNGVIKVTFWCGDSVPDRLVGATGSGSDPVRVFRVPGPLHWTPTLALSISISFLSQYVSRWRPMQDRCFNIGSALTYNNYRSVQPFAQTASPPFASAASPLSARRVRRPFDGRLVACFGREFKTSSSHWWKWLSRWSEIDPLCSIQHRSDTATGQAGATPRGCAEIKTK